MSEEADGAGPTALIRTLARVLAALACCLAISLGEASAEIVNAAFRSQSLDLGSLVTLIEADSPTVTVGIPAEATGRTSLDLKAEGSGPVYRWAVLTLRNPDSAPRSLVATLPASGFVASGLLWPSPATRGLGSAQSAGGEPVERLAGPGLEAIALVIPAGATQTFALELSAAPTGLKLWQRSGFEAWAALRSAAAGAALGVAGLLVLAMTALSLLRLKPMFAAGALLAWAAVAYMALDLGYLPRFAEPLADSGLAADRLRAIAEALMLAGLAGLLAGVLDLRREMPTVGISALVVAGAALGLAVYGWFEPLIAAGLARIGFAATVFGGTVLVALFAWRDTPRARETVAFWAVLVLWTVIAAAALREAAPSTAHSLLLVGSLPILLATLLITLGRFALGHGLVSSRLAQEAERRALALAGSEQMVWDWQASRGRFFVGSELDRALGFEPNTVGSRTLKGWIELIHPADRAAYVAAVEAAERRGRGGFAHEFRLRRGDGSYRWFLLRARASKANKGLRLIGTLADITSLRRSEDRLLTDAVHDRVTGLPNRALFLDRLDRAVKRSAADNDLSLYVMLIGLDGFDRLNDGLGHEVGDSLLSIASRRLSSHLGPEDTLARLRGDQFGLIFRASRPPREVDAFAEELRAALASPISVRPREVMLTASLGVARLRHGAIDPEELLKDAEIALYEARRKGRANVEFFHPDMRDERSRLLSLEQDLRRAVERNEIEVVFQPIMRLKTRELAGFEALVRWRRGGELPMGPDGFVGLAEEIGIIRELGRHVLSEAVRQAGIWHRAFRPREPLYVAVNLSSAELLNAELVDEVRALLAREDVRPQTLKLEITESLAMQNLELSERILDRLRRMGVGLACDDFGTGHSALASLRRLPFDMLKIDKSFLDHEGGDERAAIVLESVLLLARDLGLSVVAEGIENEDQLDRLTALGCGYGQGFHIGAPASARQVIEALGGLPYSTGAKGGMTAFWGRFVGRRDSATAGLADRLPSEPESAFASPEPMEIEPKDEVTAGNAIPDDFPVEEDEPFASSSDRWDGTTIAAETAPDEQPKAEHVEELGKPLEDEGEPVLPEEPEPLFDESETRDLEAAASDGAAPASESGEEAAGQQEPPASIEHEALGPELGSSEATESADMAERPEADLRRQAMNRQLRRRLNRAARRRSGR